MHRRNAVPDESFENSGQASKHRLPTKSNKLPESTGKRTISHTKDDSNLKSLEPPGQTVVGSLPSKATASRPRHNQDSSEILTTDMLYYSSTAHRVLENELPDGEEVPGTGLQVITCLANIFKILKIFVRVDEMDLILYYIYSRLKRE